MSVIHVQAAADHLQRLIGKQPIVGLTELIWNAIDAEATLISVTVDVTEAGAVDRVRVHDNGHGFSAPEVDELFSRVGGSWKQHQDTRKTRHGIRELHGRKGEGRWKSLAIGDRVTWESVTEDASNERRLARLAMSAQAPHEAEWSGPTPSTAEVGTRVTVTAGMKEPTILLAPETPGRICGTFALFLSKYPDLVIEYNGSQLDPTSLQTRREDLELRSGSEHGPARLTIIEWSVEQSRELCLCDDNLATLHALDPNIRAPGFSFTAYISWAGFRAHEDVLALADLGSPDVSHVVEEARDALRSYFRSRREEEHRSTIDEWRDENVYPFREDPTEPVEQAAQALFNYVAVTAASAVNSISDTRAKKLSLEAIRLALDADPGSLEKVIQEVLTLPPEKVQELHDLLGKTSLQAIISASRMIASRLELLRGLEGLLFDPEIRGAVLERAHLHKIIEGAAWLFGEEYATHVSDQSLTALLRAHIGLLGRDELHDSVPVLDADGNQRRIDFMFGRALELNQNVREHLVVEIKRPTVRLGREETDQIEDYARAVAEDSRFNRTRTRWTFVLMGVSIKDEIRPRINQARKPPGLLLDPEDGNMTVWVRTWGDVIEESRHRLKFVRNELSYDPSADQAMAFLRSTYPDYLPEALRSGES